MFNFCIFGIFCGDKLCYVMIEIDFLLINVLLRVRLLVDLEIKRGYNRNRL